MPKKLAKSSVVVNEEFTLFRPVSMRRLQDMYISWCMYRYGGDKDTVSSRLKISKRTISNRIKSGNVQSC